LEKASKLGEFDRVVDEPGRVGYIVYKPVNGRRRVLVFRKTGREGLKQPIEVWVQADLKEDDFLVLDFIIQSICQKTPRLLPFALGNESISKMSRYFLLYRSGSHKSLWTYIYCLHNLFNYFERSPDEMIREAMGDPDALRRHVERLEEYLLMLKARGMSSSYIHSHLKAIKTLYKVNGLELKLQFPIRIVNKTYYRAPRPEELQKLLEIADLREKVIISMLALGGFRLSTLVRLKYRHVKHDLERGITPIHIHVEADITKGRYCDYDTFIGNEAVDFLKLYLDQRRRRGEEITDESPLIATKSWPPRPLNEISVYHLIHRLYVKAGLIEEDGKPHPLRVHSLRKYFRTMMAIKGIPAEFIEYMMGHKISRYNDIKSQGVEHLRKIYKLADLSIRPRPHTKEQIRRIFEQAIGDIARRAGISLEGELHPAAFIEERGGEGYERLSLELEAVIRHMLIKMLETKEKT